MPDMVDYKVSNNKGFRCRFIFFDNCSKYTLAVPLKYKIVRQYQMNFQTYCLLQNEGLLN